MFAYESIGCSPGVPCRSFGRGQTKSAYISSSQAGLRAWHRQVVVWFALELRSSSTGKAVFCAVEWEEDCSYGRSCRLHGGRCCHEEEISSGTSRGPRSRPRNSSIQAPRGAHTAAMLTHSLSVELDCYDRSSHFLPILWTRKRVAMLAMIPMEIPMGRACS